MPDFNSAHTAAEFDDAVGVAKATGTGVLVKTASGAGVVRTITASNGIALTNGDGVAAAPDLQLTVAVLASLALADTSMQPGDLATVATTGDYADLSGTPTIPSALSDLSDADTTGVQDGEALLYVAANSRFEPGAAGGGSAAGADGQIQFALSGGFSADAGLAYNSTTKALTIGGATVTADSPVLNMSQTWNEGAMVFTGLKLNVTDTASAAGSSLLDIQRNDTSLLRLEADKLVAPLGSVVAADGPGITFQGATNSGLGASTSGTMAIWTGGGIALNLWAGAAEIRLPKHFRLAWSQANNNNNVADLYLYRDAAHTFAQRREGNPQEHRWWNTHTDASNGEYGYVSWRETTNVFAIGTKALGTGTLRPISFPNADIRMANLPTADPLVAGRLWSNTGVVTVSAG